VKTVLIWILALLLGTMVPALLFALAGGDLWLFRPAFFITLCVGIVLGLPSWALYRRLGLTRARWAMVGGFVIGAIPALVLPGRESTTSWLEFGQLVAGFGLLGALGALAYWAAFRVTGSLR